MNTKTSPLLVKKESCTDDIKDYAESAMNELLGWYGYDKINQNEIKPTGSLKRASEYADKNESSCSNSVAGICDDSEHESLCDSSKSNYVLKSLRTGNVENICSWCRRIVSSSSSEILGSPDGPLFCSESCFSQSRRANFKRAKVCDWCKHVRNAVNYVDFQDNASQLQFCSDKCLNQYKMQIFCNETQAHLDMNPHLKEKVDPSNSLITPELWLKNCRSRSQTPFSEPSRTPSPPNIRPVYSKQIPPHSINKTNEKLMKKPVITVAPVSKLLNKNIVPKQSLRTVKRRRLRSCRPNTSINVRNVASAETNNNNNKNPNIQETRRLDHKFTQETDASNPVPIAQPAHIQTQPNLRLLHPLLRSPPPVTILVPYPILLPLVIPIPIPLPILKPTKKDEVPTCTDDGEASSTSKCRNESSEKRLIEEDGRKLDDNNQDEVSQSDPNKMEENAEHKLPKFKITRLSSKRVLTRECEKEKNRPLRKRKFDHHQIIELDDEEPKTK